MGVQLNIKDPETVRLARELAGATGRSVTETIRNALQQLHDERDAAIQRKISDVNAILEGTEDLWKDEWKGRTSREIMDSIYDENGLPR